MQSFSVASLIAALYTGDKKRACKVKKGDQAKVYLDLAKEQGDVCHRLPGVSSIATNSVKEAEAFCKKIKIDPPNVIQDLLIIGDVDIDVEWKKVGKRDTISVGKKRYEFAVMEDFSLFGSEIPLVRLKTKSDYTVWMMEGKQQDLSDLEVQQELYDMASKPGKASTDHEEIAFPITSGNWEENLLPMLENMTFGTVPVQEAIQMNVLKLDEVRAVAKSTTKIATKSIQREPLRYVITKPFNVWFTHPEVDFPVVSFYVDQASWKLA